MSRPLRPDLPDGWFHVMNRGIDHNTVFFDDPDRVEFGQRLADIHSRFGVVTIAYCLMGNHYHLLLHCPDGGLSEAMQRLVSLYTRHVNDRLGRDGALFRGRFHSQQITGESHLLNACRYIHRNPLDLGDVVDVADYRWSSHRTYLGLRSEPAWLRTTEVLAAWGGDRRAFDEFVRGESLGEPGRGVDRAGVAALVAAASVVLAERGEDATGRLARSVALVWASDARTDRSLLQSAFGFENRHALTAAISRATRRVHADDELCAVMRRAAELSGAGVSRLGSDPWRDCQSAARAAS